MPPWLERFGAGEAFVIMNVHQLATRRGGQTMTVGIHFSADDDRVDVGFDHAEVVVGAGAGRAEGVGVQARRRNVNFVARFRGRARSSALTICGAVADSTNTALIFRVDQEVDDFVHAADRDFFLGADAFERHRRQVRTPWQK